MKNLVWLVILLLCSATLAFAQAPQTYDQGEVAKINAWTVGLAAGQLEGAPIRFATDIERVVNDGSNMQLLPIVTRGPTENIDDLLYLKGVDLAMINSDTLAQFEQHIPNIRQRIDYIISLFPSELHVFVRPGINSLDDLAGKKVNFNTQGTAAAYTGPLIFDKLHIAVQKMFIPHQVALADLRGGNGDMAAVVFVTSKPVGAFSNKWPAGFKFLPVPFREDMQYYLPATLTSNDYPNLIPEGQKVQTIAVPTILAAYNWQADSDRYRRVARLVDRLFSRLHILQGPGYHPKWKNVVLNATVPGLNRFPAAQEWLDNAKRVASTQPQSMTLTPQDSQLFREFLEWRRERVTTR